MARKPYMTSTHTSFKVRARKLRKNDRVTLLGQSARVVTVWQDQDDSDCILALRFINGNRSGKKLSVTLPKNTKVTVTEHEFVSRPENK